MSKTLFGILFGHRTLLVDRKMRGGTSISGGVPPGSLATGLSIYLPVSCRYTVTTVALIRHRPKPVPSAFVLLSA